MKPRVDGADWHSEEIGNFLTAMTFNLEHDKSRPLLERQVREMALEVDARLVFCEFRLWRGFVCLLRQLGLAPLPA